MKNPRPALLALATLLVASLLLVGTASAGDLVHYHGIHPIPEAYGGGICDIQETHAHEYVPVDLDYYQVQDGVYYWIGDPGDEVEIVELYWYEYHHPVPLLWGGGYCYIVGPHRHWWSPHAHFRTYYVVRNGRYLYRGPWGKRYRKARRLEAKTYGAKKGHHFDGHPHHKGAGPHAQKQKSGSGARKVGTGRPGAHNARWRHNPRRYGTPGASRRPHYNTRIERRQQPGWRNASRQPQGSGTRYKPENRRTDREPAQIRRYNRPSTPPMGRNRSQRRR